MLIIRLLLFCLPNFIFASSDSSNLIKNLESRQKQHVVAYGTSLTYGFWVEELNNFFQDKYPGLVTVINSGKIGRCSKWGVENLDQYVIDKHPNIVFIEFSINDAYVPYNISLEMSRSNLENMIDRILASYSDCEIVLMTMNPPIGIFSIERPYLKEYYQVYREIAYERNFLLIDHYINWKNLLENNRKLFDEYVPDGLHPNVNGAKYIILPAILKVLYGDNSKIPSE